MAQEEKSNYMETESNLRSSFNHRVISDITIQEGGEPEQWQRHCVEITEPAWSSMMDGAVEIVSYINRVTWRGIQSLKHMGYI